MLLNAQQIGVVDGADDVCTFPVDSIHRSMEWEMGLLAHQYCMEWNSRTTQKFCTFPATVIF